MRVTIIGTGYVGLTTGACLAYVGHDVACLDTDRAKVERLQAGESPIHEPGLEDLLGLCRERLRFTDEPEAALDGAEVAFIAVGTPPGPGGRPDLRYVQSAAESVGRHLRGPGAVVVNKSTVPIGSAHWVGSLLREAGAGRFSVASNPEFLREGSALHDSLYPDRVVIGADDARAREALYTLYRPVLEQSFPAPPFLPRPEGLGAVPLIATDLASAELIKYAANAFLALKVSYANEVALLAERVGANATQVARGMGLDARIGTRFLQAGLGWGGSCFGKDTAALVATGQEYGLAMQIVEAARQVNARQLGVAVDKLLGELKILKGRTIGMLGLAFKPHTDDLRDSPALALAERLIERGARVRVHDPVAMERCRRERPDLALTYCGRAEECAEQADALVLATDWPQYGELAWETLPAQMCTPVLLDGRNFLDRARLVRAGFRYLGFGV